MKKCTIFHQNITVSNVYTPKKKVSKYVRQQLIEQQEEIDEITIIACDFTYQQLMEPSGRNN